MLQLHASKSFKQDLKRMKKSGKDPEKLWPIIELFLNSKQLPKKHKPHSLSGNWKGYYDCHIEPGWLLIYAFTENSLILVRTGTHSQLFNNEEITFASKLILLFVAVLWLTKNVLYTQFPTLFLKD